MPQTGQHLEQTDRLLAESKARIEQQKKTIAELDATTSAAKAILRQLEDTQLLIVSHREALIRDLAKDPELPASPPLSGRHG